MSIGVGIFLIAVGAILRFGISTVSTNGFNVHTIGVILMVIGALGVVLWLIVWAPWGTRARSRRTVYREEVPPDAVPPTYRRTVYREEVPPDAVPPTYRRAVYREEVPPDEVPPPRRYPADGPYQDDYRP